VTLLISWFLIAGFDFHWAWHIVSFIVWTFHILSSQFFYFGLARPTISSLLSLPSGP